MRMLWRFIKFVSQLMIVAGLVLLLIVGIRKWQTYDQVHRVSQLISQQQNTSASAPKGWSQLENWWLAGENGQIVYNAQALPQYQTEAASAAAWWNKAAGRQVIVPQTTQANADVYLAPVESKYLSFSGLASNSHKIMLNITAEKNNKNDSDVINIFIHEFGHAFGLAHAPQSYNDVMSPSQIASGEIRQVSQYDRDALTAALNRIAKVKAQGVTAQAYTAIAGQQPLADSGLTNLRDAVQNARQPLVDVLTQTIAKAGKQDEGASPSVSTAKDYLQRLKYNDTVSDETIHGAENALHTLAVDYHLEKYFPFAFDQGTTTQNSDDLESFIGD
ncbi:matrixin family metalloprotease [Schleiferilactobacillus shenzhenensis]|uniref:Peptidase M10 metallopeptidase domain-containing protein n=1 Tax=Schleiferilactobacillus shenzhenensis LY-73 TaxID=1231336 RepID=U4TL10_9LACO|nr:matrixin family metalloprotease [Schleiferilactobacillus shenzhenensis]ERL64869.1 hypothetical protein L248_0473 [Schleiferilactobacillus shenzhenensis LY-73]